MDTFEIVKLILIILGFVVGTAIPFIVVLVKQIKAKKSAKTEAEKQAAINDMAETVKGFIGSAEVLYKDVNAILKNQGSTAGPVKKDSVITKLQAYALEKGYTFDAEFWSKKIDEIVKLTKQVNSK